MIERRRSGIAGWGVYATERIPKNKRIIDYKGEKITRFINHSCKPNCYAHIKDGIIWIRAARTIRKGEELCYNYHTTGDAEIQCHCRPGCTHKL